MQGTAAVLNVVTVPPGASSTQPRIVIDGIRGAIFVYGSGGPVGALIGSWAGVAGTDPYGNPYPAGLQVGSNVIATLPFSSITGQIAQSQVANAIITAAMFVGNIFVGYEIDGAIFRAKNSFGATIMTINKTAATWILYQDLGSATQGPMIASGALVNVTDEFSNTVLAGVTSYGGSTGAWAAICLNQDGLSWFTSTNAIQTAWNVQGTGSFIATQPFIFANGGFHFEIATPDQLLFQGGGQGPFISGESFHGVTLPSTGGFSGTIRVKKLPWNAIWLDVQVRWTGTTGTTYTCGSLPDASYYPTTGTPRVFNISYGDTPNSDLLGNIFVPASGALSIFTTSSASGSGTAGWYGCSVMYPTN